MQSPVDGLWLSPALRQAGRTQGVSANATQDTSTNMPFSRGSTAPAAVNTNLTVAQRTRAVSLYCVLGALLTLISWGYASPRHFEDLALSTWPQRVLNFFPSLSVDASRSTDVQTKDDNGLQPSEPTTGELAELLSAQHLQMQELRQANRALMQQLGQLQARVGSDTVEPQASLGSAAFSQSRSDAAGVVLRTATLSSR